MAKKQAKKKVVKKAPRVTKPAAPPPPDLATVTHMLSSRVVTYAPKPLRMTALRMVFEADRRRGELVVSFPWQERQAVFRLISEGYAEWVDSCYRLTARGAMLRDGLRVCPEFQSA